ncbi:MAG TPA: DUF4177 domain-containing protein [Aliiroseovarius sp.]|nr:DUF4177 domain-containing protein [Aliiroseovarius sp.]
MKFEYKVIPAPKKAGKVKGLKRGEDKFAASLAAIMNEHGAEGWEYQRTDTLPVESRAGLTGHSTTFQNMMIFRRVISDLPDEAHVRDEPEIAPPEPPEAAPEPMIQAPGSPEQEPGEISAASPSPDQPEISNAKA